MMTIPKKMLLSPFFQQGGYTILRNWLTPDFLAALAAEARERKILATGVHISKSDSELVRGGSPARKFLNAPGGDIQRSLYENRSAMQAVANLAQLPVAPTGSCGTYSYYCRPGDYLTIHRDIATCDVAVITCLEEEGIASSGGKLCVYPSRVHESLAQVRRDPTRGALPLRLAPGETVVLFGGLVPHCTLPVVAGQNRVVSLLCYRAIVE